MTEQPGIYAIRHGATGRAYVGSASNLSKRWSRHRKDLRLGEHCNAHLQAAWAKYGEEAFEWLVLELTNDLDQREQFWIDALDAYRNGFNLCPVARSSRGRTWSATERAARAARRHLRRPSAPETIEARRSQARAMAKALRKLTEEQAAEIRGRYGAPRGNRRPQARTSGLVTMEQLAGEFGVSLATVHAVIHRKVYA